MPASDFETLRTGAKMPTLGLGTWQSAKGEVREAVKHALDAGYRHIDTAAAYENEKEVGEGIKAYLSGEVASKLRVTRKDIFLTTKLDNPDQKNAPEALEASLGEKGLDTPYLDLWLMHWPAPMTKGEPGTRKADKTHDWLDTWKSMEKIYKDGLEDPKKRKVLAIGVSNFSVKFLERLLEHAEFVPAVNQIELHPGCPQHDVVEFCRKNNIIVTAYSPLGSTQSTLRDNAVVKTLAETHHNARQKPEDPPVGPANILLSLQANKPRVTVLAKSVDPKRIEDNKTLVHLTDEEIAELHKIADNGGAFRVCHPSWTGWGGLGFPDCE
ncbi:NADP-dependent oxidoreductase domain-containing protein [Mycena polygramma]|nr:NADP-dependent oxidoreductase domain-containing protein [Mycena polygramma]